jgi:hypothetical protein
MICPLFFTIPAGIDDDGLDVGSSVIVSVGLTVAEAALSGSAVSTGADESVGFELDVSENDKLGNAWLGVTTELDGVEAEQLTSRSTSINANNIETVLFMHNLIFCNIYKQYDNQEI